MGEKRREVAAEDELIAGLKEQQERQREDEGHPNELSHVCQRPAVRLFCGREPQECRRQTHPGGESGGRAEECRQAHAREQSTNAERQNEGAEAKKDAEHVERRRLSDWILM